MKDLLDQFGFDTVDAGPLKEGWRIQRDTPGYGPRRTAEELRRDLAAAKRTPTGRPRWAQMSCLAKRDAFMKAMRITRQDLGALAASLALARDLF